MISTLEKPLNSKLDDVTLKHWLYKTPPMQRMAVMICALALAKFPDHFSALDLPAHGEDAHGGSGIAGTVFRQLAKDGVLAPVLIGDPDSMQQKTVNNIHGNRIGVWRLASSSLARTLLTRHAAAAVKESQAEMALA